VKKWNKEQGGKRKKRKEFENARVKKERTEGKSKERSGSIWDVVRLVRTWHRGSAKLEKRKSRKNPSQEPWEKKVGDEASKMEREGESPQVDALKTKKGKKERLVGGTAKLGSRRSES